MRASVGSSSTRGPGPTWRERKGDRRGINIDHNILCRRERKGDRGINIDHNTLFRRERKVDRGINIDHDTLGIFFNDVSKC